MMADELSRWRQPGWGNYKRASKPPPAAAKEGEKEKKSLAIAPLVCSVELPAQPEHLCPAARPSFV